MSIFHPSYTVLQPKSLHGLPSNNITCFALNYVTHKIMLCTKQELFLYDLHQQNIINNMNYVKKFEKIYESEIKIKSVDAIILSGLWVTFVNRKSFLFFNDRLEFSKIYSAEPNPALSLHVAQRTNDIITLRGDRKMLKIWRFEYAENIDYEKALQKQEEESGNKDQKKSPSKSQTAFEKFKQELKNDIDTGKHKNFDDKGQSFEIKLYTRKNIQIAPTRVIMNFVFSEELNLIIISFDNMELIFYNMNTCEPLKTISFGNITSMTLDKENFNIPSISLEQEFLYYCDDRKMIIYDLILNEEILTYYHNFPFKVVSIHAERSNPHGGIYLFSSDEKMHVYSHSSSKLFRLNFFII